MDTRTLAEAAGVNAMTLAAWIQRGLVPGVNVGKRGVARRFDIEAAINVMILAEFSRLHISAPKAFRVCAVRKIEDDILLVGLEPLITNKRINPKAFKRKFVVIGIQSDVSVAECLRVGRSSLGPVFTVVDVRAIRNRLLLIESPSMDMVA